ncbi:Ig-like domain-containing protein [Erwinia tasmaniensis]|uniref:BIG2 domain-containing protein n=1 Tax=Erwinia tasmaniensis (strain DSM 17950 / CFBP 7177 / CIP 109463 / NCPPB 4357 / Et1/99) TaxID=465817 RepID=B2VJI2_ERWT9|nr:hypothetical protein [Erwinia tasmaniensis]CAO95594.1 Hypothetical protein ETA_05480 [Erwinia tasmaniensis Et1/99]
MKTIENINSSLNHKSATNGWDILIAYNRTRINKLLTQQYLKKVAGGENYPPFNHENPKFGLHFKNIAMGPPKVSFEDSNIAGSAVLVRLKFISGDIIRTDADAANPQVLQWDRITAASDYAVKIRVELKYGTGSVSENGDISMHFDQGSLLNVEGMNELPDELLNIFRNYLKDNAMDYNLGTLKRDDASKKLYPREFIVRTQRHPDASTRAAPDNTDGAVLLFIATNYEGKGSYPTNEQPWIIPHDKSATMLISDRLLFGPLLAKQFAGRVKDLAWSSLFTPEGRRILQFTQGYVQTTDVIKGSYSGVGFHGMMWSSDSSQNERPARLSMADFQLGKGPDNKTIIGRFSQQTFTDIFTDSLAAEVKPITTVENVPFKRTGTFNARLSLDKDSNIVFNGSANFNLESAYSSWAGFSNSAKEKFIRKTMDNLNKGNIFELEDIKTFYIRNVLFPGENILSFQDVFIPGDLAMYGEVAESLTALTVEPDEVLVAAGQKLQLTASLPDGSAPKGLIWSADGVGSIDNKGVYTAPALGEITVAKNIIVTAAMADGRTGSAVITVLASPLEITTCFINITERNVLEPFQLKTIVTGSGEAVSWRLESDLDYPGNIDNKGLYTPPAAGHYQEGYNIVTAVASLPSGTKKQAIICLCEKDTTTAFRVNPPIKLAMQPNDKAHFSTRSRDFDANQWELIPQIGKLSEPTSAQDGKMTVWSCDYQAPADIVQHRPLLIRIGQKNRPWQAGYSLVELLPSTSAWSRVCSLSHLEIISADGPASTSIYGNGVNQCTVLIKISPQDINGENVILPAEDIYPFIELVDYITGEDISREGKWAYSNKKNEYNNQRNIHTRDIGAPLYITCNTGEKNKKIAVKVRLTNPDAERAIYSTDINSESGMDNGVSISTLQPVDYTDKNNLSISSSVPVKINENIAFSIIKGNGSYDEKHTGECYQHFINIAPRSEIKKNIFKKIEVKYSPVINNTVNQSHQSWGNIKDEMSFSCLTSDGMQSCSVAGYKTGSQAEPQLLSSAMILFDANKIESSDHVYFDGVIYFKYKGGDTRYRLAIDKLTVHPSVSKNGVVSFVGYSFHIPETKAEPVGWSNSLNEVRVTVTDQYGNSSLLKLRWDSNQNYISPNIS